MKKDLRKLYDYAISIKISKYEQNEKIYKNKLTR